MILSSKNVINASIWQSKVEPETVYHQPTVSMTRNSFFLGEKFIWSFRKCIYYLVHVRVNAANQKLIGRAETFQEVTAKNCQKLDIKNRPKMV